MRRLLACLLVVCAAVVTAPTPLTAQGGTRCFNVPRIHDCISGRFREYWEQNGGLLVFGYPIAAATNEVNRDTGKTYLTQWFERFRFELHPENPRPYDVLLGRLGEDRLLQLNVHWDAQERDPGPKPDCLWFPETGRNVCDQLPGAGFKTYWQTHGLQDLRLNAYQRSLALLGLPLTAVRSENTGSSGTVETQWFERARLEWDPTKPGQFRVLPGLLGNELKTGGTPNPPKSASTGVQP